MTLIDVLKLIEPEYFPPTITIRHNGRYTELDTRPDSVFKVTLCFMCEEETWLTCNIQNAVLIPWYDCEVTHIEANNDIDDSICVWLKDEEYLAKKFSHCITIKTESEENENGSN